MKKIILPVLVILISVAFFSFRTESPGDEKFTIRVTSEKPAHFDMLQDGDLSKGLTTPYEVTVDARRDSKFIFKSEKGTAGFNIVLDGMKGKLKASWPITVIVISGSAASTFGME